MNDEVLTDTGLQALLHANLADEAIAVWHAATDDKVKAFLSSAESATGRVVLLTSGGTTVPLERNAVRHVANFSTGGRGSKLAEVFLERGWYVLFLHRKGSLLPYHRVLQGSASPLDAVDSPAVRDAVEQLRRHRSRLLTVDFETVMDYLYRLRHLSRLVNSTTPSPSRYIVLAAAVSDYYIPLSSMSEHKISGGGDDGGGITLAFQQVPKALGLLQSDWAPSSVVVSFKLETDTAALERKALKNLHAYAQGAVVANLLQSYTTDAVIYFAGADGRHESVAVRTDGTGTSMETAIVEHLLARFES